MAIPITSEVTKQILSAVKQANYPDVGRISQEIKDHIVEVDLTPEQVEIVLDNLIKDKPWEYIRGWAEFKDNRFTVTPDTLIPRLETEVLVDLAIKYAQSQDSLQIIDVGTGSGAIITSIAAQLNNPKYTYFATDISEKALKTAKNNAKSIIPKGEIHFINANLLGTDVFNINSPTLIVSNLPYIGENEYKELDPSVKSHEPKSALVGGQLGHELYIELFKQGQKFTNTIKHMWEASPSTIPHLTNYLDQQKIPHQVVRDQFEIDRFLIVNTVSEVKCK
jgi:HemK-like putative methylase